MASLGVSSINTGGVKEGSHLNVVRLCWSNHWQSLLDGLWAICTQNQFVDLNVTCRGHLIPAHKLVFAVFSPVLRDSFRKTAATSQGLSGSDNSTGSVASTTETLNLDLVSSQGEVIPYLIEFIYKGCVTLPTKHLTNLLSIAESLQIRGLAESIKHLSPEMTAGLEECTDSYTTIPSPSFSEGLNVQSKKDDDVEEAGDGAEPVGICISSVGSCRDFDEWSTEPEVILSDVGIRNEMHSDEQLLEQVPQRFMWRSNRVHRLAVNNDIEGTVIGDKHQNEAKTHQHKAMMRKVVSEEHSKGTHGKWDEMELQDCSRKITALVGKHNSSPRRNVQWRRKRRKNN